MNISTLKREAKYFSNAVLEGALDSKALKCGTVPAAIIGSTATVFATGNGGDKLQSNLKKAMQEIYKFILGISTALAILLIAWNVLKYMAATDPQTAMMAKKSAIRVAIAWVILNSLGSVATLLTSLGGDEANLETIK